MAEWSYQMHLEGSHCGFAENAGYVLRAKMDHEVVPLVVLVPEANLYHYLKERKGKNSSKQFQQSTIEFRFFKILKEQL